MLMRRLIWCGVIVACSTLSAVLTYQFTKSHYFELGKDHGSIDARVDVLRDFDAVLPKVRMCPEGEHGDGWEEVLSVKADAMYIKPIDDTSISICRAR
jgi:hypothetical protein